MREYMKKLIREVIKERGKECERCSKSLYLSKEPKVFCHHRHYRNVPEEKKEDIVILCAECHEEIHNLHKVYALTADDIPFVDPKWAGCIRAGGIYVMDYESRRGFELIKEIRKSQTRYGVWNPYY